MKRLITGSAVVLAGLLCGAGLGGCIYGTCSDEPPPEFVTESFTANAAGATWGARPIDDLVEVDIDAEAETVRVSFASDGVPVEQRFAIDSIGLEY